MLRVNLKAAPRQQEHVSRTSPYLTATLIRVGATLIGVAAAAVLLREAFTTTRGFPVPSALAMAAVILIYELWLLWATTRRSHAPIDAPLSLPPEAAPRRSAVEEVR